jgi:hypothetical protein
MTLGGINLSRIEGPPGNVRWEVAGVAVKAAAHSCCTTQTQVWAGAPVYAHAAIESPLRRLSFVSCGEKETRGRERSYWLRTTMGIMKWEALGC